MEYKFDVALSFAGEDRSYVEAVANYLKERGVKVFYDRFEQADLWGKDLGIVFDSIYRRQSKFFIPFVSSSYIQKNWTIHEFRTAIARAIESREDYILPVRFDNSELEGLRPTIGYLNISAMSPQELSEVILAKLGVIQATNIPPRADAVGRAYLSTYLEVYEGSGLSALKLGVTVTNLDREFRYFGEPYFQLSKPIEGEDDTFSILGQHMSFPKKLERGEQYEVMYSLKPLFLSQLVKLKGTGVTVKAIVNTTLGERIVSNEHDIDNFFKYKPGS